MLCGGVGGSHPASQLDADGQVASEFAKAHVPGLAGATLVSYRTQVVAGTNYYFTYEGHQGEVKVWSKPWENNYLEVTLSNGDTINNLPVLIAVQQP